MSKWTEKKVNRILEELHKIGALEKSSKCFRASKKYAEAYKTYLQTDEMEIALSLEKSKKKPNIKEYVEAADIRAHASALKDCGWFDTPRTSEKIAEMIKVMKTFHKDKKQREG